MSDSDKFKAAMRVLTDRSCNRYLMSCAHGRWDGAEKAMRHDELCRYYLCAFFGIAETDQARHDHEEEYMAVREATRALTDHLDEVIGFPLDSRPDYDRLAPLFFDKFHELAMGALDPAPQAGSGEHTQGRLKAFTQYADGEIRDTRDALVAVLSSTTSNSTANTRRLVACWNACLDIPTETLQRSDSPELLIARGNLDAVLPEGLTVSYQACCSSCGRRFEWPVEPELYDPNHRDGNMCGGSPRCCP